MQPCESFTPGLNCEIHSAILLFYPGHVSLLYCRSTSSNTPLSLNSRLNAVIVTGQGHSLCWLGQLCNIFNDLAAAIPLHIGACCLKGPHNMRIPLQVTEPQSKNKPGYSFYSSIQSLHAPFYRPFYSFLPRTRFACREPGPGLNDDDPAPLSTSIL